MVLTLQAPTQTHREKIMNTLNYIVNVCLNHYSETGVKTSYEYVWSSHELDNELMNVSHI